MLNQDGTPLLDGTGSPITTYDASIIADLARALTGWTFPGAPLARGHNPENYQGQMVPVEANHDPGIKQLFLGTVIPAGQGAAADLESVVQSVVRHPNVAPFISLRLIQHLVTSNPSSGYVTRVSQMFTQSQGDLAQVVRAILLDPEARRGDDPASGTVADGGRLRAPLQHVIGLVRALRGQVSNPQPLVALGKVMGQWLFYPPTVFNYYSPLYSLDGGLSAPEFQLVNSSNALIRANSVYELVTRELNGGVQFDHTAFTSLADSPSDLVEAVDHAISFGRLPAAVKSLIADSLRATQDPVLRVRNSIYLVSTAGLCQVQN